FSSALLLLFFLFCFFFSSRRRHTRFSRDWSSDVCSSDLLFDAGCYFTPLNGLEVVQLLFELGQTVRGEQNLFVSHQTLTLLYYERLLCSASQRSSGSCRDLFVHVSLRSQDNHKALPKTGQC